MPVAQSNARGFYGLLFGALIAFAVIVLPFAGSLVLAAVVVVLAWPLHAWILSWSKRPKLASALSFLALSLLLGAVIGLVVGLVLPELGGLARELADALQPGAMDAAVAHIVPARLDALAERLLGSGIGAQLTGALRASAGSAAGDVAAAVPGLLQITGWAAVQVLVFLLALWTFLTRGEDLLRWAVRIAPLDARYAQRLIAIFATFSRSVVFAGAVGSLLQGVVAGTGYWLAGVDRALLLAALTAGCAIIPFVGSALVWVPLTVILLVEGRTGAALFLGLWSLFLTSGADNIALPFLARGKSDLHPLLVFLGVFGGLSTMGAVGLLVGPMVAAMVVALFTIYEERRVEHGSDPTLRAGTDEAGSTG